MARLEKEFLKMRSTTAKELSELEALKKAQEELNSKNTKLADKVASLSKDNCRLTREINSTKEASSKTGDQTEALQQQVKELQQIINTNSGNSTSGVTPTKAKARKSKKLNSPPKWAKGDRETEAEVADILRALVEENALLRSMLETQSHGVSHDPASIDRSRGSESSSRPSTETKTESDPEPRASSEPKVDTHSTTASAASTVEATGYNDAKDDAEARGEDPTMEQQLIAIKLKYAEAEEARLEMSIRLEALQRYVESLQQDDAAGSGDKKPTLPQLQEKGKTLLSRIRKPGFLPGSGS